MNIFEHSWGIQFANDINTFYERIVYKKTDKWYIEWQRVTADDNEWCNEWQWVSTSGTTSDNEWQWVVQRVTMSDKTSDNEWQQMTTSGTTNEDEWKRKRARKESYFGYRMKKYMQCVTTIYSAILIIYELGNFL